MEAAKEKVQEQNADSNSADSNSKEYLTFMLGDEEYGIDIMVVREIKSWSETTRLPNMPDYVLGVINLRGTVVPIFDLRKRFGMETAEKSRNSVVIILMSSTRTIGLLVDGVSDIVSAQQEEVKPVPEMQRNIDDEYLNGLLSLDDGKRMVVLLDSGFIISKEDIDIVESAS